MVKKLDIVSILKKSILEITSILKIIVKNKQKIKIKEKLEFLLKTCLKKKNQFLK